MPISSTLDAEIISAERELIAKLSEVEATIALMSASITLRPRLGGMLNWDSMQDYERELATEFMQLRDASLPTTLRSLLVVCYGSFEHFVRELVEKAVFAVSQQCDEIEDVSEKIRHENVFRTGQVLQSVKGGTTYREYDYIDLARTLGSCHEGGADFALNATCFSFSHGIMSPENMGRFLGRMGVAVDWDRFGAEGSIRELMGEQRTRACAKAVRESMEFLVKGRNIVSHTGNWEGELDDKTVLKFTKLLPPLCSVLVNEVGRQLDEQVYQES